MSDVTDTTSQSNEQMLKDMAQSEHDSTASEPREDISTDSDRSSRNRGRRSSAVTPSKSNELTTSTPKSKSPNAPVSRTTRMAPTSAKVASEAAGKHSTVVSPTGSSKNLKAPCRPGIPWIAGARLEAKDYLDKWYPARVHDIDFDDCTVLIHFEGWNQRYDEWVPMDSDDLRPVTRHSERSKEKPKRVHRDEHRPGDYVFAKWTDCRMYPARVTRVNHNGSYEVLFYDGFRKTVQEMNIRAMPADIQQEYAKAGLLPDGTKRGKCPDGVGLSKNVPPTLKDVTAMLKAVAVKREEDVLDKKRKRMSIGESVTAKKARLAVDDTDTFVGQKSSTKQPKQVKMSTSSDRQSTSSSHGDSMDEDDMKLTEIAKGETAGSSASSLSDRGDVEAMKEPLYAADSLQLDGAGKKKRQSVARKEFKVEADHNEFKCVESSCGKSFRKKSLLDYHIKYYHMTPDTVSVTTTHTPSPAAPRKRKKTTSMCSTDSEISVGGHMGGSVNRKKRDSAASLSSLPPDTPTSHMTPIAASNSPPATEVTKKEILVETRTVEETHPGVGEESIPEEQPEEHGVAAVTSSPLKVKEEVVNCICRVSEETGLMVQCDVCLCWQHAACMELSEDTLPRRYVCFVCSNAPGLRDSARYLHDQDWLRVGAMAHFDFLPPDPGAANKAQIVSTTHDLVGDAHQVQKVLDSLRRNIHVLKDKKQPELGFWTENWDEKLAARKTDTESGVDSKVAVRRTLDMHAATDQPTQSDSCSDLQKSESDSKVTVKSESGNKTEVSIKLEDDAKLLLHKTLDFEGEGTKDRKNATTETRMDGTMENSENSSSEVKLCHKTGDSCTKDETPVVEPSRVPVTVSGSDGGAGGEVTVKSEVSETEEESKVVCERNLLDHIITSHSAIDRSLDMIEEQVTVLEMGDEMGREGDDILRDASHIKRSLHQLIADLATVRRIAAFH